MQEQFYEFTFDLVLAAISSCPAPAEVDFVDSVVQQVTHNKKSNECILEDFSTLDQYSTRNPRNTERKKKLPEITHVEILYRFGQFHGSQSIIVSSLGNILNKVHVFEISAKQYGTETTNSKKTQHSNSVSQSYS